MTADAVNRLIDTMVQRGLSREDAEELRKVEAVYRRQLDTVRRKLQVIATDLSLRGPNDSYILECLICVSTDRHDFDLIVGMPRLAIGGIKTVERCSRCSSPRESVRNLLGRIDRRSYPPAYEGDDRDRYLTIRRQIERHEASLVIDVQRWYRMLTAMAKQMKIKPEPLLVF